MARRVSIHVAIWLIGAAVLRVAVVPAEVCPEVSAVAVRGAIDLAADWMVSNQDPDGRYLYGYDREEDRVSREYNTARHAGVTMSLYQAYEALEEERWLEAADRGTAYMLDRLVGGGDWAGWTEPGRDIRTGANGLFLAGLALRRRATGDLVHDDVMRSLGRFLIGQQLPDGSVLSHRDLDTGEPIPGRFGAFATGEASWALALLGEVFPGEGWEEAAVPTAVYIAERRARAEGYIARLPDHWAAYTLSALPADLLDESLLGLARRLAGYFGIRLRMESQRRGDGINLWLRWYPGPPAGVGTAGEGIGALHTVTRREPELADLQENIESRLVCTAGFMVQRQVSPEAAADHLRPGLVQGAWFYRGYTQMDGQQHVLSALLAAYRILEESA